MLKRIIRSKREPNSLEEEIEINGCRLPAAMALRIKNGLWKSPRNKRNLEELVLTKCPFENESLQLKKLIPDFYLYPMDLIKQESEHLIKWLDPKWDDKEIMLFGKKDSRIYPGDIDSNKVILFADFGIGSDSPFALDYRENETEPTVVLLYWGKNPIKDNRWKKIAESYEEFEKIVWTK